MNRTAARSARPSIRRRTAAAVAVAALAAVPALALAAPASADTTASQGWIRLAHLSPDTPAVDVTLSAFGASGTMLELDDVDYGDVSAYERVPAGTYSAAMVPAGSPEGTAPAITQTVEVGAGGAFTVAAVGLNADLSATVLSDDLEPPAQGQAKVRLLQASTTAEEVTVQAVGGPTVAQDAPFGSSTGYAAVPAGAWGLEVSDVSGDVATATSQVDLAPGSVSTLFVLDGQDGALAVQAVTDSSGVAMAPTGGVQTGGGALADEPHASAGGLTLAGLSAAGLAVAAGAVLVLRRREGSTREAS